MIRSLDMNVPCSFLPAWLVAPGLVRRGSLLHMYSTYTGPGNRFADCSSSMFLIATQSHCPEPAMIGVVVIHCRLIATVPLLVRCIAVRRSIAHRTGTPANTERNNTRARHVMYAAAAAAAARGNVTGAPGQRRCRSTEV